MRSLLAPASPLRTMWKRGSGERPCDGEIEAYLMGLVGPRSSLSICLLAQVLGEGPYRVTCRDTTSGAVCLVTGPRDGESRRVELWRTGRSWRILQSHGAR